MLLSLPLLPFFLPWKGASIASLESPAGPLSHPFIGKHGLPIISHLSDTHGLIGASLVVEEEEEEEGVKEWKDFFTLKVPSDWEFHFPLPQPPTKTKCFYNHSLMTECLFWRYFEREPSLIVEPPSPLESWFILRWLSWIRALMAFQSGG